MSITKSYQDGYTEGWDACKKAYSKSGTAATREEDAIFNESDIANMVNMAFDQLGTSLFGRDEFIQKLINDYKNRNNEDS